MIFFCSNIKRWYVFLYLRRVGLLFFKRLKPVDVFCLALRFFLEYCFKFRCSRFYFIKIKIDKFLLDNFSRQNYSTFGNLAHTSILILYYYYRAEEFVWLNAKISGTSGPNISL